MMKYRSIIMMLSTVFALLFAITVNYLNRIQVIHISEGIYIFLGEVLPKAILAGIACVLYRKDFFDSIKSIEKKKFVLRLCLCVLLTYLVSVVAVLIMVTAFASSILPNQKYMESYLSEIPVLFSLSVAIFSPITEETVFRHILQPWIKSKVKWHSSMVAILSSSVAFAFMHTLSFSSEIVPYLLLGILFGIIYDKTDNYALVVCTHISHNLISTAISLITINHP